MDDAVIETDAATEPQPPPGMTSVRVLSLSFSLALIFPLARLIFLYISHFLSIYVCHRTLAPAGHDLCARPLPSLATMPDSWKGSAKFQSPLGVIPGMTGMTGV